MKKLKAYIYCRVSSEKTRFLLEYQENTLKEYANILNIEVFAVAREVRNKRHLRNRGLENLIYNVINNKIDFILIYDKTRISTDDELFVEFQMLCDKHAIEILTVDKLKYMISKNTYSSHEK